MSVWRLTVCRLCLSPTCANLFLCRPCMTPLRLMYPWIMRRLVALALYDAPPLAVLLSPLSHTPQLGPHTLLRHLTPPPPSLSWVATSSVYLMSFIPASRSGTLGWRSSPACASTSSFRPWRAKFVTRLPAILAPPPMLLTLLTPALQSPAMCRAAFITTSCKHQCLLAGSRPPLL